MDIFSLLEELRAIAQNGLHFATDPYDRERYERLMSLTTRTYSWLLDLPGETLRARFSREAGCITPKVGAGAAIFNAAGEILLMERADGSGWCLPCGWIEPNEKPIEALVREVREETGLEVRVGPLVGVFTRRTGLAGKFICAVPPVQCRHGPSSRAPLASAEKTSIMETLVSRDKSNHLEGETHGLG
jgi:hypothetical protein